jgi:hypothetical protein
MKICLAGNGAIGSQLALAICMPELEFVLVDDDVVEDVNVDTGTSAYYKQHVGSKKAVVLAEMVYRKCGSVAIPHPQTLTEKNLRVIMDCELIVDSFDNTDAHALLHGLAVPTVHVGVSEDRTGAIQWDEVYQVPTGVERGKGTICTHQLGRQILRFTANVAAGIIEHYLATGRRVNLLTTEKMNVMQL